MYIDSTSLVLALNKHLTSSTKTVSDIAKSSNVAYSVLSIVLTGKQKLQQQTYGKLLRYAERNYIVSPVLCYEITTILDKKGLPLYTRCHTKYIKNLIRMFVFPGDVLWVTYNQPIEGKYAYEWEKKGNYAEDLSLDNLLSSLGMDFRDKNIFWNDDATGVLL